MSTRGIYLIELDDPDFVYIGQTNNLELREKNHRSQLENSNSNHHCIALQEAFNKMEYKSTTFKWLYKANENENLKYLEHIFAMFYSTVMRKKLYNTQACNMPDIFEATPIQCLDIILPKAFKEDSVQAYNKVTSFIGNLLKPVETAATVTEQPEIVEKTEQEILTEKMGIILEKYIKDAQKPPSDIIDAQNTFVETITSGHPPKVIIPLWPIAKTFYEKLEQEKQTLASFQTMIDFVVTKNILAGKKWEGICLRDVTYYLIVHGKYTIEEIAELYNPKNSPKSKWIHSIGDHFYTGGHKIYPACAIVYNMFKADNEEVLKAHDYLDSIGIDIPDEYQARKIA